MPLFSYHCPTCDKDVELLMRLSDTPVCPTCGGTAMERLMSRVAPELKSPGLLKAARARAGREGHLSNFSRSERGG
ncbi:FmdB family zinc ribbon protein [Azorhizobium doebereinerae]|uniref:FmdB family zinc ribbon protein n=1 Tax=Azorhizobium doebereinerae TaxID=281091 RepID=UPI00040B40EB|nr:zinc ribbon domain-containing protein [Azorhizobium doebereinerae]